MKSNTKWLTVVLAALALAIWCYSDRPESSYSRTAVTASPSTLHAADKTGDLVERYFPGGSQIPIASTNGGFKPVTDASLSLTPTFPASLNDTLHVASGNASVDCRAVDGFQFSAGATAHDGSLVYGNEVVYRSFGHKTEEFIKVDSGPAQRSWSWEIDLGTGVQALNPRLTAIGSVELADAKGTTCLRIDPPYGKDANGRDLKAGERLAYSINSMGQGKALLKLNADLSGMAYPVIIDPSFSAAHNMSVARAFHTATLLPNGQILVAGGLNGSNAALGSCELYDPSTDTWATTGSMVVARSQHTAVLLGDGRVLVVAGLDASNSTLQSAEVFDPNGNNGTSVPGSWSLVSPMTQAGRFQHTMTLLPGGTTVLVAGGNDGTGTPLNTAEIYDATQDTWTPTTGNLIVAREFHTETLLNNGQVLLAGGTDKVGTQIASAELYNPATGIFIRTQVDMISGRYSHKAALMPNGQVLIIGGFNSGTQLFPSAELYDPVNDSFALTGSMSLARTEHRIVTLTNGKVIAAGCHTGTFANVENYDPATGQWNATHGLVNPHTRHGFTLMSDGRGIVTGGFSGGYLAFAEIFDPHSEPIAQTVIANGSTPLAITLGTVSIDDNPSSFKILTSPSHGTLSGTAPNLVYTADPGYSGPDSFTFRSHDFFGDSKPATIAITVNSLVPTVSSTRPDAQIFGSSDFVMTVDGSNFVFGSVVLWNGGPRPTTFVSVNQLAASITAADVSSIGQATITVINPTPGGGTSTGAIFNIVGGTLHNWVVTNTDDSGLGSLRSALNNVSAGESITFDPTVFDLVNSNAATVINVLSPLPVLDKQSVTIDASNQRVTINGAGAGSTSGFVITSNGNSILGLGIVGFTQSGIQISGGNNNIIGGSRALPSTHTGPNGQGLRISGCGTFGIDITNSSCNNVVKGCWIGLDSSGTSAEPNLAGILIHGQACGNQIGSTLPDEANVVSGNSFEGITVSDLGTNGNIVIGNIVGGAAISSTGRSVSARDLGSQAAGLGAVGNGSAGVFLSKGTNGTQVGGTGDGQANAIGDNGGNGIEVRALTSKGNSSHHNGITKNHGKGIALFDGSNNGILPPNLDQIQILQIIPRDAGARASGAAGLSNTVQVKVSGNSSAPDGSSVEVFTDSGSQGGTFVASSTVSGGQFNITGVVDSSQSITATVTDPSGNTSTFADFGSPPGVSGPIITSALLAAGNVGSPFSYTITASGTQPITFTATPLPDGLSLSGDTIVGTPTTMGTYTVTLTATNGAGSDTKTLILVIEPNGVLPPLSADSKTFNPLDSNQDGIPDVLAILAGLDPTVANPSLTMQGGVSLDKAMFKLNFGKSTGDGISASLSIVLPNNFTISASTLGVQLGAVSQPGIPISAQGKGSKNGVSVQLKQTKGANSVSINLSVKGQNIKPMVEQDGMLNLNNAPGQTITMPIALAISNNSQSFVYTGTANVFYLAKKDKGGIAKKVP